MKTTFLIDGFNLYHSIDDLEHLEGTKVKWLNIHSLLKSYLPHISNEATLNSIYYFTALRLHLQSKNPDTILRHKRYIEILKSFGIQIEYGKFKQKTVWCNLCRKEFVKYEEKQTDIAIINKLWELVVDDSNDAYVIVTGDTDIIPGIKTIKRKFPRIKLYSLFPYHRKNDELVSLVDGHFKINKANYLAHQLNDPFILPDGRTIAKPLTW
ncbi:MAG: NYN domain-containing protein [Bacteroidales bacterium]|nr:NYN domain-containing protein [Bacteroidales bacterium]